MSFTNLLGIGSAFATNGTTPPHGTASIMSLLPMLIIFVVVAYFLIIRPQSKRAKEQRKLMDSLNVGDEVITVGGIVGRVVKLRDNYVVLKLAENVEITMQKNSISNILPKGTLDSMEK